jgi:hypothetical protein
MFADVGDRKGDGKRLRRKNRDWMEKTRLGRKDETVTKKETGQERQDWKKKSLKKKTEKNKGRNRESGSGPAITTKEDEASNKGS